MTANQFPHLNATTRLITLCPDLPNAPAFVALCTADGWNGFHVPNVDAHVFVDYMAACRAADPDGPAQWPTPFVDDGGLLRLPAVDDPDNRDADTVWINDGGATYWLDGLVWVDA